MPGVSKDGKPTKSYGYDVGGKTQSIKSSESQETAGHKFPPGGYHGGNLGKLDRLNTDRFIERKPTPDDTKQMAKTGYESSSFDKSGNVKGGPKSDVSFLEPDGSWAPAEGRGSGNTGNVAKRGKYSGTIKK
jgi:hypothetical protein